VTLTWPVALAVLFAAFLHAAWNALVKSGQDKALDTAAQNLVGWPLAVGVLVIAGLQLPPPGPGLSGRRQSTSRISRCSRPRTGMATWR